jgi:hypothetical protein
MISAAEALSLPRAQLTAEEKAAADALESLIDENVRISMSRRGCNIEGKEFNPNVIAEVNQRLKTAGYMTNWQFVIEQNRFNKAVQQPIGFRLELFPTDEAYRKATN